MFSSNEEEQKLELKKFIEDDPKWRLEQIILNEKVRETVLDVITFCKNKDRLIEEWGLNNFLKGNSSIGINLYGEPGTGKSITAEAIAMACLVLILVDCVLKKSCYRLSINVKKQTILS